MDGSIRRIEPAFVRPVDENHEAHEEPHRPFELEKEEGEEHSPKEGEQPPAGAHSLADHHAELPVSPPPAGSAGSNLDLLA
ncbi:MAG: hypothetical protein CMK00_07260 [Planctomycetes bacterium]|jgi:hypothetical protein|nr:hypothetical protein [Planctomycetota bacterium]